LKKRRDLKPLEPTGRVNGEKKGSATDKYKLGGDRTEVFERTEQM